MTPASATEKASPLGAAFGMRGTHDDRAVFLSLEAIAGIVTLYAHQVFIVHEDEIVHIDTDNTNSNVKNFSFAITSVETNTRQPLRSRLNREDKARRALLAELRSGPLQHGATSA